MKPTIYTLAARAGVSIATVSRAFNDSPRISQATRARILQIAAEIGYQPSASARELAANATRTLALVFPQISTPFFSEFIRGAETAARQRQYHLLVYSSAKVTVDDPLLRMLPSRTDGIILGTDYTDLAYVQRLRRQNFPMVLLGYTSSEPLADGIFLDNEEGAYQLVRHLLVEHAYRRIAYISGPDDRPHSDERLKGCQRAYAELGLTWDPDLMEKGNFEESGGFRAAQALLRLPNPPRAIFAANDQTAIGVISAAAEMGLDIPNDLAVAGFDDIPTARYLHPPLTTVKQALYDQGILSVKLLLRRIAELDRPAEIATISPELVVRQSCGCAGLPPSI